jgi:FMN phosphatase YigB (HAD superfamily)
VKIPAAIFFDFDGVLCTDRFYTTLHSDLPEVMKFIDEAVFGGENNYSDRWMRGELTYKEVNKIISAATGVSFEKLTELFIKSVRQMTVNPEIIRFASSCRYEGIKTALVTDNMDIFNEITVTEKHLAEVFPVIVNSCDYGILKLEDDGRLFDITLEKAGLKSYIDVWLIDNSPRACTAFINKGGQAYLYTGQTEFNAWLKREGLL